MGGRISKKVLLVDDDLNFVQVVEMGLSSFGYDVNVAHDGQEALEKMKFFVPDIVLSDVMMPRLDGVDLLDRMRGDQHLRNIPVIIITAKENLKNDFLAIERCDFIAKPFEHQELLDKMESAFHSFR